MVKKSVYMLLGVIVIWVLLLLASRYNREQQKYGPTGGSTIDKYSRAIKATNEMRSAQRQIMKEQFGIQKNRISPSDAFSMSKRSIVQAELKKIQIIEMTFYVENGYFTDDIEWLREEYRMDVNLNPSPYKITIQANDDFFIAQAIANIDDDEYLDIILIDDEGEIFFVEDDLKNEENPYPFY